MATRKKKHVNPKNLKVGDKVLMIRSNNSQTHLNGKILTVTKERASNHVRASLINGSIYNLYYTGPADEFILAGRKEQADYKEIKLKELEAEVKTLKQEIDHLRKYTTEEEYVAAKLDAIMTAHEKGGTKKTRVTKMAELLKEMKNSNIL